MTLCAYVRLDRFILALADGWSLPFVVEPMRGHHGAYSVLMTRGE